MGGGGGGTPPKRPPLPEGPNKPRRQRVGVRATGPVLSVIGGPLGATQMSVLGDL